MISSRSPVLPTGVAMTSRTGSASPGRSQGPSCVATLDAISCLPSANALLMGYVCSSTSLNDSSLVIRSARFCVPITVLYSSFFLAAFSCAHDQLVSKCRALPMPRRQNMPRSANASDNISMGMFMFKPLAIDCMPRTSADDITDAYNSDSAGDGAIKLWDLLQAFTQRCPNITCFCDVSDILPNLHQYALCQCLQSHWTNIGVSLSVVF